MLVMSSRACPRLSLVGVMLAQEKGVPGVFRLAGLGGAAGQGGLPLGWEGSPGSPPPAELGGAARQGGLPAGLGGAAGQPPPRPLGWRGRRAGGPPRRSYLKASLRPKVGFSISKLGAEPKFDSPEA